MWWAGVMSPEYRLADMRFFTLRSATKIAFIPSNVSSRSYVFLMSLRVVSRNSKTDGMSYV